MRDAVQYSPRVAGSVTRYHTWPTIQHQTVADHTFHVLRIWMQLWGAPRAEVTEYILCHDMGEISTGDIPFGAKRKSSRLKQLADELEDEHQTKMWGSLGTAEITDDERRRAKICDLLEMWEFGRTEIALGNRLAGPIVEDTWHAVVSLARESELDLIMERVEGGTRW